MKTHTKEFQENLTPEQAIEVLKEGNVRFMDNLKKQRNLTDLVSETSAGQYPFAVVLSCIDSRVPVEVVFDQGIGDMFSVRVAGNIANEDILGSMEYACKVAGSKLLLVMGHTKCGAVTSACQGVELGNITPLLSKIKPAVQASSNIEDVDAVAKVNVELTMERIRKESAILNEMEQNGEIKMVGAMYSVETGEVTFF